MLIDEWWWLKVNIGVSREVGDSFWCLMVNVDVLL